MKSLKILCRFVVLETTRVARFCLLFYAFTSDRAWNLSYIVVWRRNPCSASRANEHRPNLPKHLKTQFRIAHAQGKNWTNNVVRYENTVIILLNCLSGIYAHGDLFTTRIEESGTDLYTVFVQVFANMRIGTGFFRVMLTTINSVVCTSQTMHAEIELEKMPWIFLK